MDIDVPNRGTPRKTHNLSAEALDVSARQRLHMGGSHCDGQSGNFWRGFRQRAHPTDPRGVVQISLCWQVLWVLGFGMRGSTLAIDHNRALAGFPLLSPERLRSLHQLGHPCNILACPHSLFEMSFFFQTGVMLRVTTCNTMMQNAMRMAGVGF